MSDYNKTQAKKNAAINNELQRRANAYCARSGGDTEALNDYDSNFYAPHVVDKLPPEEKAEQVLTQMIAADKQRMTQQPHETRNVDQIKDYETAAYRNGTPDKLLSDAKRDLAPTLGRM